MLNFKLAKASRRGLTILCVGAHSDDIEIGCGGTLLRLLAEFPASKVHWVVMGSSGPRNREAVVSARKFLMDAKTRKIVIQQFKEGSFPYRGERLKRFFENLKARVCPDVIFTHYREDRHQDHRCISDLTWQTYRDHLILEYEIVKYDGDFGIPNVYVHLDDHMCRRKIGVIMESFKSQRSKDWFTRDAFFAMLRLRGIESRAPDKYAEAFYCRKVIL